MFDSLHLANMTGNYDVQRCRLLGRKFTAASWSKKPWLRTQVNFIKADHTVFSKFFIHWIIEFLKPLPAALDI
jgi:hypothetical protein